MKVLLINGSPRREGNTFVALSEVAKALNENGVETEIVSIGTKAVQGCIACGRCAELGHACSTMNCIRKSEKNWKQPTELSLGRLCITPVRTALFAPCLTVCSILLKTCWFTSLLHRWPCVVAEEPVRHLTA